MTGAITVKNTFISTDVVCAKFFGSFVLAGVGGILKIFSLTSNKCVKEIEIFKGHKIYGIQQNKENHILIYGSKSVRIFDFSDSSEDILFTCIASITLEDWIVAAHWLSDGDQIALVTAHNIAWLWSCRNNISSPLKRAVCSEKCILYSATVCGDDWSNCVVFAGTVFREVVVWLPAGSEGDQPVLHRLEGHNGVIFSLTWDWQTRSLCSTSDDRSVRLWNISLLDKRDWKSSKVICSHVFYGHSARVWKSIILEDLVVSVGEDCQICVWSLKGKLLQTFERSTSGCQWSIDYSSKFNLLVTGAGDGSIQLIPLTLPLKTQAVLSVSYPDCIAQSTLAPTRKIILLSSGCIVAISDDGSLLSGYPGIPSTWTVVCRDERFANYCLLSVGSTRTCFSLASLNGFVALYEGDSSNSISKVFEQKVEDGKIWSLLWLSKNEILVCGDEGRLMIWQLSQREDVSSGRKLTCIGKFRLPRARERWPTCATLVTNNNEKFLLCGDRCGSVHLFTLNQSLVEEQYAVPNHSLSKLHGKLGVTSIQNIKNQVISTGRDGTVRTLRVNQKSLQVSVISTDKMPMDWVCTVLCPSRSMEYILIVGFKETNMVIWSTEERRIVLQLDCGGGHRSWDCIMSDNRSLEITFVREKCMFYTSQDLEELMKPTLLNGISPRELNCLSSFHSYPSALLFGGEDGTIYVCKFSEDHSVLEKRITLTSHISSVRCLSTHGNFFFSAGGRAQLKAWRFELDLENEITCVEEASHMLKGERNPRSPPSIDPEMRYMSICSVPNEDDNSDVVQLVAGYSDGALRWLTFDSTSKTIQVNGESMFHGKCVLKLFAVQLPTDKVLISTATDGRVALWYLVPEMFEASNSVREPFWSTRSHQSGVNSIHVRLLPATEGTILLLASGGDDNSVVLTALHIHSERVSVVAEWSSSSAHAAQVTGVWLIGDLLISTSIDQRLTFWQWSLSGHESVLIKCQFLHQIVSSIPDIQDMKIWQEKSNLHICLVGKGVQTFSLPFNEDLKPC